MDGSAKDFLNSFKKVDIKTLSKKRKYLRVLKKIELIDRKRKILIEPDDDTLEVNFQLNYDNKIIGKQENTVNFQRDSLKDVSASRTFCLFEDIEKIKKAGLAKGGSLDNAVVISKDKVLNEGGLRNSKEFVNHKILDLVGDFLLSGYRVIGKIRCIGGGHELSNMFLKKLFEDNSLLSIEENSNHLISKGSRTKTSIKIAVNA